MIWNNVDDSLPPEDYSVLIVDDMQCMYVGWLIEGKWYVCDSCRASVFNATHWAELPEFPDVIEIEIPESELDMLR